tara:strand:+ start:636 stop:1271 length:636 start_codon:yes stop_codon:yes gene_type:complete
MTITKHLATLLLPLVAVPAMAELKPITDSDLVEISGQGGVYLSGEIAINKDGGPLWSATPGQLDDFGNEKVVRNCGTAAEPEECGLRFAVKLNSNSEGWYVLDDLSGGFSFEGLTLRTENRPTAIDYDYTTDGGQTYTPTEVAFDKEVVVIGLPGTVGFNNFKFTYAVANNGEWGQSPDGGVTPFVQTDLYGIRLDGDITLQGNLLLYPVN